MKRSKATQAAGNGAAIATALALLAIGAPTGCSKEAATNGPASLVSPKGSAMLSRARPETRVDAPAQNGATPPAGLVSVEFAGENLELWPYTGASFDASPSDPVNVLFVGRADPVKIRAALLSLDGNRTAFGFPDEYPFNATWSDAIGDVQTNYSEGEGWQGSVIQLQLGTYQPIRAHLRLFRTGHPFGANGTWTVGAVHFEVLIPGTADHQVLSWELPQQILMADMVRSGLLDPAAPLVPTQAITQTPSFRTIPDVIYNELPEALKAAIGGPPGTVSSPVPIGNDGAATVFNVLGEAAPRTGEFADSYTLTYGLTIPKPLCSDGPLDWVYVSGPVTLSRSTTVDASGRYRYETRIAGQLSVTPTDVTQTPPTPSGESYRANVGDLQQGAIDLRADWVMAESKRIAPQKGGAELQMIRLRASTQGPESYQAQTRCLAPEP